MEQTGTVGLVLFGSAIYSFLYLRVVQKPHVIVGNSEIQHILEKCPSIRSLYWPSPYCWEAHLQLIPFVVIGEWYRRFPSSKWFRQMVRLEDEEEIAVDWVVSAPGMEDTGLPSNLTDETPILVLHHGAFGCSADIPGQKYIAPAIKRGWFVCVLNRRGHACPLTKGKWNFFGCVKDVHCVTQSILALRPKAKLFTVGQSAGSALVATIFGYDSDVNDFHAGACVCPGFDITKCMARFKYPFSDMLLAQGKKFFLELNRTLVEHLPGFQDCLNATDLQAWIDHSYAMAGCESQEDYYNTYNPINYVYNAKRPVISINSEDDPLCVVDNYNDQLHKMRGSQSTVGSILTKTGGHCSFYEGLFLNNWAEKMTFEFFDAYLETERHKK